MIAKETLLAVLLTAILKYTIKSQIIVLDKPGPFYLPEHTLTPDGQTYYIPDIQIEFDILLHNTSVSGQIFHLGKPHDYLYWYPIILITHYNQFSAGWTEPAEDLKAGNKYRIQNIKFPFFVNQWQHMYCRFNESRVYIEQNNVAVWNQVITDPFILTTNLDEIWDIFIGGDSYRSSPNATMANIKVTSVGPLLSTLVPTTAVPTNYPTDDPSNTPTNFPSNNPTNNPSNNPTDIPTNIPSNNPTADPTVNPTNTPSNIPTNNPTNNPTSLPTKSTFTPTHKPSIEVIIPTYQATSDGEIVITSTSTKDWQQTEIEQADVRNNSDIMLGAMIGGFSFLFCIIMILVFVVVKLMKTKQNSSLYDTDIQMKEIGSTYIPPKHVTSNNCNNEGNVYGDETALLPPIIPAVKDMYAYFVNQEFSDDSESDDIDTKPGETDGYQDNSNAQLINDINTIK